jgi:hypothetical protein
MVVEIIKNASVSQKKIKNSVSLYLCVELLFVEICEDLWLKTIHEKFMVYSW